jgi:hypothetical protein
MIPPHNLEYVLIYIYIKLTQKIKCRQNISGKKEREEKPEVSGPECWIQSTDPLLVDHMVQSDPAH